MPLCLTVSLFVGVGVHHGLNVNVVGVGVNVNVGVNVVVGVDVVVGVGVVVGLGVGVGVGLGVDVVVGRLSDDICAPCCCLSVSFLEFFYSGVGLVLVPDSISGAA